MFYMIKFRLKELLDENKISAKEFSKALKLSGSARVYEWINGFCLPKYNNLISIANYFNCSLEYLLGRTETNEEFVYKICPPFDVQLKNLMNLKKITQYKMIKDEVVNSGYFRIWFKMKSQPTAETLIKLADYFNISIDELVGRV